MTSIQLKRMSCQPVERQRLTTCLKVFGVWPLPAWSPGFSASQKTFRAGRHSKPFRKLTIDELFRLYEAAKVAWKKLCWKYRPDIGDHEVGVWLNALWAHTDRLFNQMFKRMGVETA